MHDNQKMPNEISRLITFATNEVNQLSNDGLAHTDMQSSEFGKYTALAWLWFVVSMSARDENPVQYTRDRIETQIGALKATGGSEDAMRTLRRAHKVAFSRWASIGGMGQ